MRHSELKNLDASTYWSKKSFLQNRTRNPYGGLGHFDDTDSAMVVADVLYEKSVFEICFPWAFVAGNPPPRNYHVMSVRWKDSASDWEICQLWRDRISARDCPQFPNGLVQFLMLLAGNCVVCLGGLCGICDFVLTCKKKKS